jgi:hypothetical protein
MPFNQLRDTADVNGGTYVVPGNKTLQSIIDERKKAKIQEESGDIGAPKEKTLTTEQIEAIIATIGGVAIASIVLLKVGSWISNHA